MAYDSLKMLKIYYQYLLDMFKETHFYVCMKKKKKINAIALRSGPYSLTIIYINDHQTGTLNTSGFGARAGGVGNP